MSLSEQVTFQQSPEARGASHAPVERGGGLQPGEAHGKALRQERTWTDVHVQIVKEITGSYGKGFAFYPHCNGNLEVLSKI